MKAAVYKGNKRFEVEEIPTPEVGPRQVLVKVRYSAICGTDVHTVLYDVLALGAVMGHEFCGTIAKLGTEVTRWKVGDRVVGGGGTPPPGITYGLTAEDEMCNLAIVHTPFDPTASCVVVETSDGVLWEG